MVAFVKDSSTQARQPKQAERHTASEREREQRERESTSFARRCLLYSGTFVSSNNMHDP
jgi:hypothetical protein